MALIERMNLHIAYHDSCTVLQGTVKSGKCAYAETVLEHKDNEDFVRMTRVFHNNRETKHRVPLANISGMQEMNEENAAKFASEWAIRFCKPKAKVEVEPKK